MPQSGTELRISPALERDVPLLFDFVRKLAEYEKLSDVLKVTEDDLAKALFGDQPVAEAVLAFLNHEAAGFAIYYTTFSTFTGKCGLYLEDLFVNPQHRGKGIGKALLRHLAALTKERGYARLEWAVLNWNAQAIDFYRSLGASTLDEWILNRLTGESLEKLAQDATL